MKKRLSRPIRFKSNFHIILLTLFFVSSLIPPILFAEQKKLHDDLFSVSFSDEKNGWACGRWGTILHTSDGAKTWERQNSGIRFTLSAISFVDSKNGWAVGDLGTIIHTVDGGKTWKKQESSTADFLMDVCFVDKLRGWVVGERTTVLSTPDGGRTWKKQFGGEDYILKAISFCDPLYGWAVGEYGYIYRTKNGGMTWEKQAGEFNISRETGEIIGGTFLFDVVAIDPKSAWSVGIDGYVTKTSDGGKSWQPVTTGARKTQLFSITSDKKNRILIGGNWTVLSSVDSGKTWQIPEFKPPLTYGWIYGLAPRGASGFVAVGWKGAIYVGSSNTWERIKF